MGHGKISVTGNPNSVLKTRSREGLAWSCLRTLGKRCAVGLVGKIDGSRLARTPHLTPGMTATQPQTLGEFSLSQLVSALEAKLETCVRDDL